MAPVGPCTVHGGEPLVVLRTDLTTIWLTVAVVMDRY